MCHITTHLSTFSEIVAQHVTKASVIYTNTPFANMYPQRRGLLFEDIGRKLDPHVTVKPHKMPGRSRASYDWLRPNEMQRVECKSAQLSWNKSGWVLHFKNIKVLEFDILMLCFYTPNSLLYFECEVSDLNSLYSQGALMSGGQCMVLRGGKCDWEIAAASIRVKLNSIATKTACVNLDA
jgi:hypothetical protein